MLDRSRFAWDVAWPLRFGWRGELRRARRAGYDEGDLMIPDDGDTDPPPFLLEVRSRMQELAERLALGWQRDDEEAHGSYAAAFQALKGALAAQALPDSNEAAARARYEQVRAHAGEVHERLNPPGARWYCSSAVYYTAVAILAVLDVPLTAIAFQTFGMDELRTNLAAVLVVLLLAVIGHFVGHGLRRVRWGDGAVLLGFLLLISGGYIVGLGFAREQSIAAVMTGEPVLNHFWDIWLFIAVTTMGLVVPALLARHERDEPLAAAVRGARREWRRALRERERALRRTAMAAEALRRAMVHRRTAHAGARREVSVVQTRARICMQAYVVANVRAREGNRTPPGLREGALPTVAMPDALEAPLTWDPPLPVAEALLDGGAAPMERSYPR